MAKVLFFILRLAIGVGSILVLAGTLAIFLASNLLELIKGVTKALASVVVLFASGFTKSNPVAGPELQLSPAVLGIAFTFLAIFASVFMPGQKIFLHIVAVMAIGAGIWDGYRSATNPGHPFLYLPLILLWLVYYVWCLRRA